MKDPSQRLFHLPRNSGQESPFFRHVRENKYAAAIESLGQHRNLPAFPNLSFSNQPFQHPDAAVSRAWAQQTLGPDSSLVIEQTPDLPLQVIGQVARLRQQLEIETVPAQMLCVIQIDSYQDGRVAPQVHRNPVV